MIPQSRLGRYNLYVGAVPVLVNDRLVSNRRLSGIDEVLLPVNGFLGSRLKNRG